jgi:hypothetical protein
MEKKDIKDFCETYCVIIGIEWNWLCVLRARRRLENLEKSGKALSSEEFCRENSDLSRHCVKLMRLYDKKHA